MSRQEGSDSVVLMPRAGNEILRTRSVIELNVKRLYKHPPSTKNRFFDTNISHWQIQSTLLTVVEWAYRTRKYGPKVARLWHRNAVVLLP